MNATAALPGRLTSLDAAAVPVAALRAHQAAELWLALQKKEAIGHAHQRLAAGVDRTAALADPFTPDERALYAALTARLVHDVSAAPR